MESHNHNVFYHRTRVKRSYSRI